MALPSIAAVNGCGRFAHPLTGFELPEEVHFAPRSCILLDNGRASCPPRGILHYLATGGGEIAGGEDGRTEYVNPGDVGAWLDALDRRICDLQLSIDKDTTDLIDTQTVLWDLECKTQHTHAQVLETLAKARHGLASAEQMEEYLVSNASLSTPIPGRIDDIRRAIVTQRAAVDDRIEQAKESATLLSRQGALRTLLQTLIERSAICAQERRRLQANRDFIAQYGFVKVTSSPWQRGTAIDVLSWQPKYCWSDYCWSPRSSLAHPEGLPAGAWFQIELPEGFQVMPTHYALRHGDDGQSTAPGLRHDSNCSLFSLPDHAPQGMGTPPTSWGVTTRAKRAFNGTALFNWQLWASSTGAEDGSEWTLLRDHIDDRSLHGAFEIHLWPLTWIGGKYFRFFRVIMTGPCSNGAHALMCSGFELYGQVGKQEPPPPKPKPPGTACVIPASYNPSVASQFVANLLICCLLISPSNLLILANPLLRNLFCATIVTFQHAHSKPAV